MLMGTDTHGTIIVTSDGESYRIDTSKDGTISPESTGSSGHSEQQSKQDSDAQSSTEATGCVNINSASAENLQEIIHIGPERAQDVIDGRPYNQVKELDKINGIGPARLDEIISEGIACVEED